jgi:hypothetical protein
MLFDAARKAGDKTIIDSVSGYYVLYFEARRKANISGSDVAIS